MAADPSDPDATRLLAGSFGSFQRSALAGADTATVWSNLRQDVGAWILSARGTAQPFDPVEQEAAGRQWLSDRGVNAITVGQMRAVAGEWRAASQRLVSAEPGQQITAQQIFTPPWAITNDPNVPSRYRIRTQWQVEGADGDTFTRWKADELQGPLTTIDDALAQAAPTPDTTSGQAILAGQAPPVLLGYEIEQI